jgi:uncharacterized protein YbjT (DUF2867 family)
MKPKILIAGASGATGIVATQLLLERGFHVRALVHNEDERSTKLRAQGAEIIVGDLLDMRAVRRVFHEVQRAYFVYPMRPGLTEATAHFAEAALEAKTEFIVNLSQKTSRPDAISDSALHHWLAERVFDWAGTPVAHLRPSTFNKWFLWMRKGIRDGKYHVPFGPTGHFAPIAAEDLGHVIAAILADPTQHAGQFYELFGPVELTPPEIAEIITQTLGKEVRYKQISPEEWISDIYEGKQVIPFLAQHLKGIVFDHERGMMAGTNDVVEKISGRRPMTVAEFIEKHREAFQ